ncbi:hypothetical protein C8R43DRAFT_1131887 [Mycena crocata]|nr:hypothetical protein C8R43DRAFT_1131887 [Mycena crocata]
MSVAANEAGSSTLLILSVLRLLTLLLGTGSPPLLDIVFTLGTHTAPHCLRRKRPAPSPCSSDPDLARRFYPPPTTGEDKAHQQCWLDFDPAPVVMDDDHSLWHGKRADTCECELRAHHPPRGPSTHQLDDAEDKSHAESSSTSPIRQLGNSYFLFDIL